MGPITYLSEEKKQLGFAKKKLFGVGKKSLLKALVEKGVFLPLDLFYAKQQKEHAPLHALLFAMARKGHLCVTIKKGEIAPPLSELASDPQSLSALQTLLHEVPEGTYSLPRMAALEESIAHGILRLLSFPSKEITASLHPEMTEEQALGLHNALTSPFSLITGGPGTGKTYTAKQIAAAFRQAGREKILLTAPTGKAASHLGASFPDAESGTLHSFLRCLEEGETLDADLIIVDESSMIDPLLFSELLGGVGPETALVLMGDADQLPAVEGGSLFADLIEEEEIEIPRIHLTKSHRSDRREILDLAASIVSGEPIPLCNIDLGFASRDLETIYTKLWEHTKSLFPTDWLQNQNSFQILSTLRKGPLGSEALNHFFYEKFAKVTDQFPIMIIRNDIQTGLSNGDMGVLFGKEKALFPTGKEISYSSLPPYEYAYCISVHKSQGSEYDHVLFLVPEGSEAFGREVLYTAVTRARNKLEIDGDPRQIASALSRSSRKHSTLRERLKNLKSRKT
ncbi:MAG: RecBCD enzyme subunit RecD [Chlamydiae bacterium]|nr:RecBCD enzyme subunit RecD [Chlamydiota bacterium]